jgi:hypothetical protein
MEDNLSAVSTLIARDHSTHPRHTPARALWAVCAIVSLATTVAAQGQDVQLVGWCDMPGDGDAIAVFASGSLAYVADGASGLQIVDVSNPSSPTLRGSYDTPGSANGVFVDGGLAYVAGQTAGLLIIDVSNPSSPTLRGSYDTPGWAEGVFVVGGLAYVADQWAGLQIIDVSNPSSPTLRGSYATAHVAKGVFVAGGLAYVADFGNGFQIIDVSNPSLPTLRGSYDTPLDASGIFVAGGLAYVAAQDRGLRIVDVSNPTSPTLRGSYDTPSGANGVFVAGGLAYVAGHTAGLLIIDVSNPSSPQLCGSYDSWFPVALDVFVAGGLAYVAEGTAGLAIFRYTTRVEEGTIDLGQIIETSATAFVYHDFRLSLLPNQASNLLVRLTPLGGGADWTILLQRQSLPTLSVFDSMSDSLTPRGTVELLVPSPEAGTYFLTVYSRNWQSSSGRFRLEVVPSEFYLSDVTPRRGGNTGRVTLQLRGLAFTTDTVARLIAPSSAVVAAESLLLRSSTELYATFDLRGASVGLYDVQIEKPGSAPVTAADVFEVVAGLGPRLEARLIVPPLIRPGQQYTIWLEYGNSGDADMPAPLFLITGDGHTLMELDRAGLRPRGTSPLRILGLASSGPRASLSPGASERAAITITAPQSVQAANFALAVIEPNTEMFPWDEVEPLMRSEGIDPGEWASIWNRAISAIGATWNDVIEKQRWLANQNDAPIRESRSFDESLEFLVAYYGSPSTGTILMAKEARVPRVWYDPWYDPKTDVNIVEDRYNPGAARTYVIVPGWLSSADPSSPKAGPFNALADAIKSETSANVLRIDYKEGAKGTFWDVSWRFEQVGDEALRQLAEDYRTLDFSNVTFITHSHGAGVAAHISNETGCGSDAILLNPPREQGYLPLTRPDFLTSFDRVDVFKTQSFWDANAAGPYADHEILLDFPGAGHGSGLPWLTDRILAGDNSYLEMTRDFPDALSGFYSGTVDEAGNFRPGLVAMLWDELRTAELAGTRNTVGSYRSTVIRPIDPNEKTGPLGLGDPGTERFVAAGQEMTYAVYFENVSTATAPAQEVTITDNLDVDLDWSTFRLGEVTWGDHVVTSLAGRDAAFARTELTSSPYVVDVEAQIFPATGMARWTLRTIDPATNELTTDPLAGFLPPNDASGRGEGHVTFLVRAREDLTPGARITNKAFIVFDVEASMQTNEVFNTIAPDAPDAPGGPSPANAARNVPVTTFVSCSPSTYAIAYDIFFWRTGQAKPTSPTVSGLPTPFYDPPGELAYDTGYSWQIVARNVMGQAAGATWSFRTKMSATRGRYWTLYE